MDVIAFRSALIDALERAFEEASLQKALREDMRYALAATGKLLAPVTTSSTSGYWAFLPMSIVIYHRPAFARSSLLSLGLSCECLLCALDIFDEVEDDDRSDLRQRWGNARYIVVATALLSLSHSLLSQCLRQAVLSQDKVLSIRNLYTSALLRAIEGQHKDIVGMWDPFAAHTDDECIAALEDTYQVAEAKSGALFQLVCRLCVSDF